MDVATPQPATRCNPFIEGIGYHYHVCAAVMCQTLLRKDEDGIAILSNTVGMASPSHHPISGEDFTIPCNTWL